MYIMQNKEKRLMFSYCVVGTLIHHIQIWVTILHILSFRKKTGKKRETAVQSTGRPPPSHTITKTCQ